MNVVKEGDYVLLEINGERLCIQYATKHGHCKIGKMHVSLKPVVGAPYGAVFEVQGEGKDHVLARVNPIPVWDGITSTDRTNASIVDDGGAQQLTMEEIEKMKSDGVAGTEIIKALTKASATFASKNDFSQEKYLRKKQKRYCPRVIVRRPTARFLCDSYFTSDPRRTQSLRVDTLSQLLSLGNVSAHARVLVVDYTCGLLSGACIERMGGLGLVVLAHGGYHAPPMDIVRRFNFTRAQLDSLRTCSLAKLMGVDDERPARPPREGAAAAAAAPAVDAEAAAAPAAKEEEGDAAMEEGGEAEEAGEAGRDGQAEAEAEAEPAGRAAAGAAGPSAPNTKNPGSQRVERLRPEEVEKIRAAGFTSVVVAWPVASYKTLLPALLPIMAPSASFVAYHTSAGPLTEAFGELFSSKQAANLMLSESWARDYQVLPARTHPKMAMSGTGGYLLAGTRILRDAPGAGARAANGEPAAKKAKAGDA